MRKLFLTCAALIIMPLSAQAADKPNVVLMLGDNLGYGDLSTYNGGIRGGIRSPNIDQLASEGMKMTQFLVEPGCTPSRAGLMTGQYSIRTGNSLIILPGAGGGLIDDDYTLGEMFKSAGYDTTYVGKWHLGPADESQPQNQGFDQWLVGFKGTSDSTLYEANMKQNGAPEQLIEALKGQIIEAKGPGKAKPVRAYDFEYRKQIEGDIAKEAVSYITEQAKTKDPFFLMIGWTRPHFPNDVSDEFKGKSGAGKYGDSILELDYRTGQVLDAIEKAGIEDNTIIIWISDNGPTMTGTTAAEIHAGDAGPFRGELGDAYEGSIRTAGMIKWEGKIKPQSTNEMFSIHDFLPTLANIVGGKMPRDGRPIDGVDQSDFLLGKQENSNRQHLLTFLGDRLAAVRWNQYRMYPFQVRPSDSINPSMGGYVGTTREMNGIPEIYNIEVDPKEMNNISTSGGGWLMGPYVKLLSQYKASVKKHSNRPVPNVTDSRK